MSIEFAMKLGFILTEGRTHDNTQSDTLLQGINTDAVVADKAFDSDALLHTITDTGAKVVIPPRSNGNTPREFGVHQSPKPISSSSSFAPDSPGGIHDTWDSLCKILRVQRRVTSSFKTREGHTLDVRKASQPEAELAPLYAALALDPNHGGTRKLIA